jgi:hypothetical protein
MAASPNLLPWFETARIAAKFTQAAPAMARLLTMRPGVWNSIRRLNASIKQFEGPAPRCATQNNLERGPIPLKRAMLQKAAAQTLTTVNAGTVVVIHKSWGGPSPSDQQGKGGPMRTRCNHPAAQ